MATILHGYLEEWNSGPYEAGVLQADNHLGRERIGLMAMGGSGRGLVGEGRIEGVGHGE